WLEFYADRFQTVELNNSFYRLPSEASFTDWRRRTPDDFVFAVKMSRFLTHQKRLRDPAEPVELFLDRAKHLGSKLGPVLVQLPPSLEADPARLREALKEFPETVRVAVEFRHASWFNTDRRACALRDASVFARLAEGAGLEPSRVTAEASVSAPDGEQ